MSVLAPFARRKSAAPPRRPRRPRLAVEPLEARAVPAATTAYLATDLVSDQPGVAPITDPTLVNAWGISLSPTGGAFWVSANGTDLSEVYAGDVERQPDQPAVQGDHPRRGRRPARCSTRHRPTSSSPTGRDTRPGRRSSSPPRPGTITGWNPSVGVAAGATPPSRPPSAGFQATDGAIYKGLALARSAAANFLYADRLPQRQDRRARRPVPPGHARHQRLRDFTDPNLPAGLRPVQHRGHQRQALRQLRQAGRRRRGRRRRPGPRLHRRVRDRTATSTSGWCRAAT